MSKLTYYLLCCSLHLFFTSNINIKHTCSIFDIAKWCFSFINYKIDKDMFLSFDTTDTNPVYMMWINSNYADTL